MNPTITRHQKTVILNANAVLFVGFDWSMQKKIDPLSGMSVNLKDIDACFIAWMHSVRKDPHIFDLTVLGAFSKTHQVCKNCLQVTFFQGLSQQYSGSYSYHPVEEIWHLTLSSYFILLQPHLYLKIECHYQNPILLQQESLFLLQQQLDLQYQDLQKKTDDFKSILLPRSSQEFDSDFLYQDKSKQLASLGLASCRCYFYLEDMHLQRTFSL